MRVDASVKTRNKNSTKIIIISLSFLLIPLFTIFFYHGELQAAGMEYPEENFFAPSFELSSLSGEKFKLTDYRGKVVLINFWATWCVPCKLEMDSMEKLYQRFKGQDFELLAINVDRNKALVQPYLDKYHLFFPVLLDPESLVARKKYKIIGVPETYIVDKGGIILHKAIGPRDWFSKEMIKAFEQLVLDK